MPLYEYRCEKCGELTARFSRLSDDAASCTCEHCGASASRIVSRSAVHLSKASKLGRLDPKYDKMVDRAMARTQNAEPDRLLRKMKPLTGDQ